MQTFEEVFNMIVPFVEEHERTIDPDNIRDFLDLMIVEHQVSSVLANVSLSFQASLRF